MDKAQSFGLGGACNSFDLNSDLPTVAGIIATARNVVDPWDPMIEREIRLVARQYVKLLMRHRLTAIEKHRRRNKETRNLLLSSRAEKICALILSSKKNRSLGYYIDRAEEVRARHPSAEPLHVVSRPKGDGSNRSISIFGLIETAKQTLVRDVLIAQFGHSPFEFSRRGRGREAVIRNTLHALNQEGITHLVEADICDCFPSVKFSGLSRYLHLPASVVRNTVQISGSTTIHIANDLQLSKRTVRAGLPLGSRLSPFVMSKIIEPILDQIDAPIARSFVDNIGFGARSSIEAAAGKLSLAVLLDQHPAGPFKLKYSTPFALGEENDILGYLVRPQSHGWNGIARVTPSKPSILRAQRRMAASFAYSSPSSWYAAVDTWASSWASRYPSWSGRKNGATSAFLAAHERVLPHVREFHRDIRGTKFSSFAKMGRLAQLMATFLEEDPFYYPLRRWDGGPLSLKKPQTAQNNLP